MKIVILGFTKIKYMPYLNMYLNEIDTNKHMVHVLYWSRDSKEDCPLPENVIGHSYDVPMEDAVPLQKKLLKIYQYGLFAKHLINELRPDFLIVLHSTTAYTIKTLLINDYSERFFFDYRDLTYERRFRFYGNAIKNIANHACATFTSSDGFRNVLPENGKVYTSHNIMEFAEELHAQYRVKVNNTKLPIKVAFWGLLRHVDINQQIIEKLCSDSRFEVHYYGRAQGKMLQLMNESSKRFNNFVFHGEYKPDERLIFSKNTDMILNLYDKKGTTVYAMGNKYYDGVTFCIPQLCTSDTYMGDQCVKANVGFACNPYDDSFVNDVFEYYKNLDRTAFIEACDVELNRIMEQVKNDREIIRRKFTNGCE